MANNSSSNNAGCAGGVLAMILSWALNHSVIWCLVHGMCSWFYVLYVVFVRTREIAPALKGMFGW